MYTPKLIVIRCTYRSGYGIDFGMDPIYIRTVKDILDMASVTDKY